MKYIFFLFILLGVISTTQAETKHNKDTCLATDNTILRLPPFRVGLRVFKHPSRNDAWAIMVPRNTHYVYGYPVGTILTDLNDFKLDHFNGWGESKHGYQFKITTKGVEVISTGRFRCMVYKY
jgi:hypothetical protein